MTSDYDFQARSHNYVTNIQFCSHFPAEPTQLKEKELKPIPSCESSHKLFAGLQSITYGNSGEESIFLFCYVLLLVVMWKQTILTRTESRGSWTTWSDLIPQPFTVCLDDFDMQLLKQSLFTIKQYYFFFNNGLNSMKQDCTVQKVQE